MKKIGLYGGTFDPIHFGHINLALDMLEKRGLDEVWFCPAFINPHKLNAGPHVSSSHRYKMIELALSGYSLFKIINFEIEQSQPSYTFDTLKHLLHEGTLTDHHFSLIIGEDTVPGFFHWYKVEEIVDLVPILVGSRTLDIDQAFFEGNKKVCEALIQGWTRTRIMEISSTDIRDRLKNKQNCRHLVPHETLYYIYKNELYY